jgi:hypothetical protein
MLFANFNAGDKEYKLKLTTEAIVTLEKQLGCNPISIFASDDTIPTVTAMVQILHASLQQYEHGITLRDSFCIFDKWLEDGHTVTDFLSVILDIYRVSGTMQGETKNGMTEGS